MYFISRAAVSIYILYSENAVVSVCLYCMSVYYIGNRNDKNVQDQTEHAIKKQRWKSCKAKMLLNSCRIDFQKCSLENTYLEIFT